MLHHPVPELFAAEWVFADEQGFDNALDFSLVGAVGVVASSAEVEAFEAFVGDDSGDALDGVAFFSELGVSPSGGTSPGFHSERGDFDIGDFQGFLLMARH